jgi:hypothetical protein
MPPLNLASVLLRKQVLDQDSQGEKKPRIFRGFSIANIFLAEKDFSHGLPK